jgi:hypothetical protein
MIAALAGSKPSSNNSAARLLLITHGPKVAKCSVFDVIRSNVSKNWIGDTKQKLRNTIGMRLASGSAVVHGGSEASPC